MSGIIRISSIGEGFARHFGSSPVVRQLPPVKISGRAAPYCTAIVATLLTAPPAETVIAYCPLGSDGTTKFT